MKITKKLTILALICITFSCNKEEPSPTAPSTSGPFTMTIDGTAYNYTPSELYGFFDTNNDDVNVKSSPGLDPIGAGGFSLTDLDENATAGSTQPMDQFNYANLFFADNSGGIYNSTSGTITYTSHDKSARTISGSFTAVLTNSFNTSVTKNVAGSFDFAYPNNLP
jgi:hypothetical protein